MSCIDCDTAALKRHHAFTEGCRCCLARATGRQPQARLRIKTGDAYDQGYRRLLAQFGVADRELMAAVAADKGHEA